MNTNIEMRVDEQEVKALNKKAEGETHTNLNIKDKKDSNPNTEKKKLEIKEVTNTETNLVNEKRPSSPKNKRKGTATSGDMELVWKDIQIVAKAPTKGCCSKTVVGSDKVILNSVSGRAKSGECLAIIGSSGAGKTTLLNHLSRKIESKNLKVSGDVLLNGEQIDNDKFNLIASYVMQDDILEPTMTPLEILMFTAKLKLKLSNEEIEKKVKQMIDDLHLNRCQNTKVGSVIERGVSGGERKRTSIGVELISDPKIVFLDEPTTGLDSFNAYEVIQLLQELSALGKTVIFTIHQPSSEIFDLLDKLCILALGKTVFFGPHEKSLDFFEYIGLKMPAKYNPFEHFMEMTNVSTPERKEVLSKFPELESIENHQQRYEAFVSTINGKYEEVKETYQDNSPLIQGLTEENHQLFKDKNYEKNFFYEFGMLFLRNTLIAMRNPKVLFMKIGQAIVTGCLLVALFVRISKDFSGVQDRLGILFNIMVFCIMGAGTHVILLFSDERKVFTRERSNKLYSVSAYFFSKTLSEIPIFFIQNNLLGLLMYFGVELNDTYSYKYYVFLGILNFITMAGVSFSFFISTLATNQEALINLNTALTIPLLLLSGYLANADNFAPYLIPFKYISSFKYGFQTLVHNEFTDLSAFNCHNMMPDQCNPMPTRFLFLEPYYVNFIGLACLIVLFKGLALLMLYLYAKIKV